MKKYTYDVPKGIRYISELEGIFEIPNEPCIIDKQLTGCGFTHWVINNNENVVLCSPRRLLLENKEDQNPHVLYVKNDSDLEGAYEKDISNTEPRSIHEVDNTKMDPEKAKALHVSMKNQIRNYLMSCNNPFHEPRPAKILVTYDSFRIVKEVLTELQMIDSFRFIVDEFQSIFVDSRFKSTTELGFVKQLQGIQKVCYVSATPMMEEYLDELEDFKNLPYCQMNWGNLDPMRVMKPVLEVRSIGQSINATAKKIIKTYLDGDFERTVMRDGDSNNIEVESREAVIFVNSVKNITDIIKGSKLRPDQVNILCSNTTSNQAKINKNLNSLRKLGPYLIGTVPTFGEPHKMFTFCTRTVYLGADFYSTNARSFIFSDANIDCLAVDITLDLPQILGRQRLICNPWKNDGSLFVRLLNSDKKKSKEEFERLMKVKIKMTEDLLEVFEGAATDDQKRAIVIKYEKDAKNSNYRDDYVAVDNHGGSYAVPVPNNLVRLSEKRAFEIQQVDYADRFQLFNSLENYATISTDIAEFFFTFNEEGEFTKKMKLLCEHDFKGEELDYVLKQLPTEYAKYYYTLGPEKIKSWSYRKYNLENEYNKFIFSSDALKNDIYSTFIEGEKLTMWDIVDRLTLIYEKYNYPVKPKATDIKEYFEVGRTKKTIIQSDGSKAIKDAFKLIKRLR